MEHTFSQATTPGQYRCSCGWEGSDYVTHRREANRATLHTAPGELRILHQTPRPAAE